MRGEVEWPDKKKFKFFYLNGSLHKILHRSRSSDQVKAYDYTDGKRKIYVYSEVLKTMQQAYTLAEVAKMVGRSKDRVYRYISEGLIAPPQREYLLDQPDRLGRYWFSEDDVLDLIEYMSTVHWGRPRKDGMITNDRTPTRRDMRAMMKQHQVIYVKEDGEFVPIWKV